MTTTPSTVPSLHSLPTELIEGIAKQADDRSLLSLRATSHRCNEAVSRLFAHRYAIESPLLVINSDAHYRPVTDILQRPHVDIDHLWMADPHKCFGGKGNHKLQSSITKPTMAGTQALLVAASKLGHLELHHGGRSNMKCVGEYPVNAPVLLKALTCSAVPTLRHLTLRDSRVSEADLTSALLAHKHTLESLDLTSVEITEGSCLSFLHSLHNKMDLQHAYLCILWSDAPGEKPFVFGSSSEFEGYAPAEHVKFGIQDADGERRGRLSACPGYGFYG